MLEFTGSPGRDLGSRLLHLWPAHLAYVTSFVTIGIIWMNHHRGDVAAFYLPSAALFDR